jgi:8-oxo-dGTP pyrophosphatase MutT (NUDIX family)
VSRRRPPG